MEKKNGLLQVRCEQKYYRAVKTAVPQVWGFQQRQGRSSQGCTWAMGTEMKEGPGSGQPQGRQPMRGGQGSVQLAAGLCSPTLA